MEQKKNAAVGFGSVFVALVSATMIECGYEEVVRNLSVKRARSPYENPLRFFFPCFFRLFVDDKTTRVQESP